MVRIVDDIVASERRESGRPVMDRSAAIRSALAVYLVVNPDTQDDRSFSRLHAALKGGVTMVQVRMPGASRALQVRAVQAVQEICRPWKVPVVMNNDVGVAQQAGVGIHLGQDDEDPAAARARLGATSIVGLTIWTQDDAQRGVRFVAGGAVDYLSIGAVFASPTKQHNRPPQGIEGLQSTLTTVVEACRAWNIACPPLVAISGITPSNVEDVLSVRVERVGINGVAVSSAIMGHPSALLPITDVTRLAAVFRGACDRHR